MDIENHQQGSWRINNKNYGEEKKGGCAFTYLFLFCGVCVGRQRNPRLLYLNSLFLLAFFFLLPIWPCEAINVITLWIWDVASICCLWLDKLIYFYIIQSFEERHMWHSDYIKKKKKDLWLIVECLLECNKWIYGFPSMNAKWWHTIWIGHLIWGPGHMGSSNHCI